MPELEDCRACSDSIDLDEVALVLVDGAEVAVIGCDTHLRRVVLALEVLDALETIEQFTIPQLVDVVFEARLRGIPNRRLP